MQSGTQSALLPKFLACPGCRSSLATSGDVITCRSCRRSFAYEDDFPSLLLGPEERFPDIHQPDRDRAEENANTFSTNNFLIPLLKQLFGDPHSRPAGQPVRILSNACGVGIDVDLLNDAGFETYGIDCGGRINSWPRRRFAERLYIASAKALPFADGSFDFVSSGCLLPHIGVVDDSTEVVPDYLEHRKRVASEMVRVLKPGGYILMNNPNRRCPIDFHHMQPKPERLMRFHPTSEPFLLSFQDHQWMFLNQCGCSEVKLLPPQGYWGCLQKRNQPGRRLLVPFAELLIKTLSSKAFRPFLPTGINPWLFVLVRK